MEITGQQRRILRVGIIGAYPNKDDLHTLLSEEMSINFNTIIRGNGYNAQISNLIQDFEADGKKLEEFIKAVVRNKPNSPYLQELKREFAAILQQGETPPDSPTPLVSELSNTLRKPKYSNNLKINTQEDLEKVTAFFKYTTKHEIEKEPIIPLGIIKLIEGIPDKLGILKIIISGVQGTGKTAFLSILYNVFELNAFQIDTTKKRYPLFISADDYIQINDMNKIRGAIEKDINEIKKAINEKCQEEYRFILIVDGLSGREREVSTVLCEQVLFPPYFQYIDSVIFSIADSFEVNDFIKKYEITFDLSQSIQFQPIKISEINAEPKILQDYIYLNCKLKNDSIDITNSETIDKLKSCLNDMFDREGRDAEVDQHILSLIYEKVDEERYFPRDNTNLATFLEQYCKDFLCKDQNTVNNKNFQNNELRKVADLAYRLVVQSFYENISEIRLELKIKDDEKNTPYWNLIFEHSNIRDFLAAWHIIDILRYGHPQQEDKSTAQKQGEFKNNKRQIILSDYLGYDFPKVINRFIRRILKSNNRAEDEVVKTITLLLKDKKILEASPQGTNFLYYLLGRCSGEKSVRPLENALTSIKNDKKQIEDKFSREDRDKLLQLLTNYRTISISLMKHGRLKDSEEFFKELIFDTKFASIDRGYHRLYYGDSQYHKNDVPQCYVDVNSSRWIKSYEALKENIDEKLEEDGDDDISLEIQHNIFTLVSFIQSRLNNNSSDDLNDQLDSGIKIINLILKKEILPVLKDYLESKHKDFERYRANYSPHANYSPQWCFILNLYNLKFEPRRGWLHREIESRFKVGRIESVADHTVMTQLLAKTLLPDKVTDLDFNEKIEDYTAYDKNKIINFLLYHDIAESLTGDYIYPLLDDNQKIESKGKEDKALMYVRFMCTYEGIYGTREIYEYVSSFSSVERSQHTSKISENIDVNAKIARDIDKLENLIQLYFYKDVYHKISNEDVFRPFYEYLIKMNTSLVQKIANNFVNWAKENNIRKFFEDEDNRLFFDKTLLAMPKPDSVYIPIPED